MNEKLRFPIASLKACWDALKTRCLLTTTPVVRKVAAKLTNKVASNSYLGALTSSFYDQIQHKNQSSLN